jgi:cytochrome P450/NADPH-cytochrome P450 reductase
VSDAADNDIFNDFDKWADHVFWPGIEKVYGIEKADPAPQGLDIEIITHSRSSDLRQDVREAIVKDARVLTAEGEPEKRHIELQLPTDMSYQAGDYLAVLPINHDKHVKAIMTRFSIPWDSRIIVKEGQNTVLPTGKDVMVYELLASYVELNQPATQKVSPSPPHPGLDATSNTPRMSPRFPSPSRTKPSAKRWKP